MEITTVNGIESIVVENSFSSAVISLLGGHITSFVPAGKSDLLWMSNKSEFAPGKAIRGGVPVCWPWFGDKAPGLPNSSNKVHSGFSCQLGTLVLFDTCRNQRKQLHPN